MNSKLSGRGSRSSIATFVASLAFSATLASGQNVTIDGVRDVSENYSLVHTQTQSSGWGDKNLANLHATQEGNNLFLHLASKSDGDGIILFLDTKPGGVNFIANNLITSGGEEDTINNLGASTTAGMTFETGFEADYAIRIFGLGQDAYVNIYDLSSGSRTYAGNSGVTTISSGIVFEMKTIWGQGILSPDYATASLGVEMALPLAGLGVAEGEQTIGMSAMLVWGNSVEGSNQVLGSREVDTNLGLMNIVNFETEAGIQTLNFTVQGPPAVLDPNEDEDQDGLLNGVETNTGVFVSSGDTGTDPYRADTDGDGFLDGDEVTGSGLGYISNPNIPNYMSMAVPGNFTDPQWQPDGSVSNSMVQGDTSSLTEQYQWTLEYDFRTLGAIVYKYAANGSWNVNWGTGGRNGGDINAVIQASGFHTFSFDNSTVTQSLTRTVFPTVEAYLSAYGVPAGVDSDGDGLLNEAEYAANTDPTNLDSDSDGTGDATDPNPLAATRDVVFSVDMSVQQALGNFDPALDSVVVDFFNGLVGDLPDLELSPVGDGVWSAPLPDLAGAAGALSGGYKFRNTRADAADGGYEGAIDDRTFNLEPANTTQTLVIVFFNNLDTVPADYSSWSATYVSGQAPDLDFDGDGIQNGVEYFMGNTSPSFTANPGVVNGKISWPRSASATGLTYKVLTSENLTTWEDATASSVETEGLLEYTLPTSASKLFVRLEVIVP